MAKVKVVILKLEDKSLNLLTTIKQSSVDEKNNKFKKTADFECSNGEKLLIYEAFLCGKKLDNFKNNIIKQKTISFENIEVKYNIGKIPRESFLLHRDEFNPDIYNQILSPFYSNCNLYEYWNTDLELRNIFMKLDVKEKNKFEKSLDVNLYNLIDRVGNILHFVDIHEIDVNITHQNNKYITLGFQKYKKGDYICNIKVKSYDDLILNQTFRVQEKFYDFELQDADYEIDIEISNLKTEKCVLKRNFVFFGGGNPKIHYIKNNIEQKKSYYSIETNKQKTELSETVSSLEHTRKLWTNHIKRIKNSEFSRFVKKQDAYPFLVKLLEDISKDKGLDNNLPEYIYLMDPYLFCNAGIEDYIGILNSIKNIEFRLMGCRNNIPEYLKEYIKNDQYRFKNIRIKLLCLKSKDKKGQYEYIIDDDTKNIKLDENGNKMFKTKETFHDRWIATKNQEYGFTNSINNFQKGVSFFKSYEHYFNESEELWNTCSDKDTIIEEFFYDEKNKRFEEK